jgi:hypothetical protein
MVGEKNVQHFGRAYAVQNLNTKFGLPLVTNFGGQGFTGAGAHS